MVWRRAKRWLYANGRPGRVARGINACFAALHAAGLGPASWVTLAVTGSKSGLTRAFPLVMVALEGRRFLVSMLGEDAAWVRNVAAAGGRAELRRGQSEPVQLTEIPVSERAPVLRAYLRAAPGARPHLPVRADASLAELEAIAARFPVFRVDPLR
jgi:hypothetical protein